MISWFSHLCQCRDTELSSSVDENSLDYGCLNTGHVLVNVKRLASRFNIDYNNNHLCEWGPNLIKLSLCQWKHICSISDLLMGEYLFVIIMKKQSMTSLINGHAKTRKPHTSKSNKKKKNKCRMLLFVASRSQSSLCNSKPQKGFVNVSFHCSFLALFIVFT